MARIVEVDPHDEEMLRAYFDTEQAAMRADRPDAQLRTWAALRSAVQQPSPYYGLTLLLALDGDRAVGTAEVGGSIGDNERLADLEITVLPESRRQGIGRALHDEAMARARAEGRSTVCGEVHVPFVLADADSAAYAFARALGCVTVHREDHLVLRLPVAAPDLASLRATAARRRADGFDVVSWTDRCPDEYAAGYCAMKTQMSSDVPIGEIDYEPIVYDEQRLRTMEERTARSHHQIVAAARRTDGAFGGYTVLVLPHGDTHVVQGDTLVMPEHRGRRLGHLLKLATLELVLRDHPDRQTIHTWTDPDNHAMYRTNVEFGYRLAERMHEMQRKDA